MRCFCRKPWPSATQAPALVIKEQQQQLWMSHWMSAHQPGTSADKLCHGQQPVSTILQLAWRSADEQHQLQMRAALLRAMLISCY